MQEYLEVSMKRNIILVVLGEVIQDKARKFLNWS